MSTHVTWPEDAWAQQATAARAVAEQLEGWTFHDAQSPDEQPRLARADGAAVTVTAWKGRIILEGQGPPDGWRSWRSPQITVTATASPMTIAKNLTRRLLPTYLPQYAQALAQAQATQQAVADAAAASVQALIPDEFRTDAQEGPRDTIRWRRTPTSPHARGRIQVVTPDDVDVTIDRVHLTDVTAIVSALFGPPTVAHPPSTVTTHGDGVDAPTTAGSPPAPDHRPGGCVMVDGYTETDLDGARGWSRDADQGQAFTIELTRSIQTTVRVRATDAQAAFQLVNRAEFPLPPREDWDGLKDWTTLVYTSHSDEPVLESQR